MCPLPLPPPSPDTHTLTHSPGLHLCDALLQVQPHEGPRALHPASPTRSPGLHLRDALLQVQPLCGPQTLFVIGVHLVGAQQPGTG